MKQKKIWQSPEAEDHHMMITLYLALRDLLQNPCKVNKGAAKEALERFDKFEKTRTKA